MIRFYLIFLVLNVCIGAAMAQQADRKIVLKPSFGGLQFERDGETLSPAQVQQLLEPMPEAFQEMKKARESKTASTIIGGAGGFLFGYSIGAALAGGEANRTMAGIGGGLMLISIPYSLIFRHRATNAVEMYNADASLQSKGSIQFRFGVTPSGFGMVLQL